MAVTEVTFIVDVGGTGDYINLEDFEAAEVTNAMVANDEQYTVDCWSTDGTADATACAFSTTWVTDATHYIKVWTDPANTAGDGPGGSYRHSGIFPTAGELIYRMSVAGADAISLPSGAPDYIRFIGLAIEITGTGSTRRCINSALVGGTTRVESCIVRATGVGATNTAVAGILKSGITNVMHVYNCIAIGFRNATGGVQNAGIRAVAGSVVWYNNTVRDCATGYQTTATPHMTVRNCLAQDCVTIGFTATTYDVAEFNAGDDGSAPGTDAQDGEVTFVNEGTGDLHLASADTIARGNGMDLSADATLPITTDIDGQTRSAWDIGADEFGFLNVIGMDAVQVNAVPRDLVVVPGTVTVTLDAAQANVVALDLTVSAGAVTIAMDAAQISALVQDLTVVPGAATVAMDTAQVNALARQLSISSGATTVALNAANVSALARSLTVVPGPVSIGMDAVGASALVNDHSILAGAVAILLDAVQVNAVPRDLSIVTGAVTVLMDALGISAVPRDLTVVPGTVTVTLDAAQINAVARPLTIDSPVPDAEVILMEPARASLLARALTVVTGAVTIALDAVAVSVFARQLTIVGGALSIGPGRLAVVMAENRFAIVYGDGRSIRIEGMGPLDAQSEDRIAVVPADPRRGNS